MNEIEIFKNKELGDVRTLIINGEPWFVGKDVAKALGYSNPRDAILKHVLESEKGVANCDTLGGIQEMVVINESGMYSLVFGSKLEKSKKFRMWVTSEVLPSIRKHGMYITNELLQDKEKLEEEIKLLREEMYLKDDKIEELEKVRKEYMIQRGNLFNISIKTGINSSYIPDLTLQVIRNFIKNNPKQLLNVNDNNHTLKVRPLIKELKKLIMRRNDIIYIITLLGMRIENNNVIISNKLLDDNYTPIQEIYM